jgi:hypothetical protein
VIELANLHGATGSFGKSQGWRGHGVGSLGCQILTREQTGGETEINRTGAFRTSQSLKRVIPISEAPTGTKF